MAAYNYCVQVHGSSFPSVPDTLALCQAALGAGLSAEALRYLRILRESLKQPIQKEHSIVRLRVLSVASGVAAHAGDEQQAAELLAELLAATAAELGPTHPQTQEAHKSLLKFTEMKPQVVLPQAAFSVSGRNNSWHRAGSATSSAESKANGSSVPQGAAPVSVTVTRMMEPIAPASVRSAVRAASPIVPTRLAALGAASASWHPQTPSSSAAAQYPASATSGSMNMYHSTARLQSLPGVPPAPPSSELTPPTTPGAAPSRPRPRSSGQPQQRAQSAEALYTRGMVLRLSGELLQAVDALQAARRAFEDAKGVQGGQVSPLQGDVARVDMTLGLTWHQLGDLAAAQRHYDAAYCARLRMAAMAAGFAVQPGTPLGVEAQQAAAVDADVQEALTHLNGVRRLLNQTPLDRDTDPAALPPGARWAQPREAPLQLQDEHKSPVGSPVHPLSAPSTPGSEAGDWEAAPPATLGGAGSLRNTGHVHVRPLLSPRGAVAPYRITPLHPDEHVVNGIVCVGLYLLRRLTQAVGGTLEVGTPSADVSLRPVGLDAAALSPGVHGGAPLDPFASLAPPSTARSRAVTDIGPRSTTGVSDEGDARGDGGSARRRRRPRYGHRASFAVEKSRQQAWRASVGLSVDSPISRQWTNTGAATTPTPGGGGGGGCRGGCVLAPPPCSLPRATTSPTPRGRRAAGAQRGPHAGHTETPWQWAPLRPPWTQGTPPCPPGTPLWLQR